MGIEYLIAVPEVDYQKYQDNLVFFLGHKWSPKGYSWIFPMDNQQLKIGAAWLDRKLSIIVNENFYSSNCQCEFWRPIHQQ